MKKIKSKLTKGAALLLSVLMLAGAGLPFGSGKVDAASVSSGGVYGAMDGPVDVAFDAAGNLYIANIGNNSINKVTPEGIITVVSSGGVYGAMDGPVDIAFDAAGNMYIANTGSSTINRITPEGVVTVAANNGIYGSLKNPLDIEFDIQGNMYITGYKTAINKITPEGVVTSIASGGIYGSFSWAYDIAFDSLNNMYIADVIDSRIIKVTPAGVVETAYSGGQFGYINHPLDIEFDPDGNMYVANLNLDEEGMENPYVMKITPQGSHYVIYDDGIYGNLDGMEDIEFDSSGAAYIARASSQQINKIGNLSGTYTIQSKNSSLLMDVQGGGTDQGVNVIQWPSNDGMNQQWIIQRLENGYYTIQSKNSGMSLDVYGGGADQGNRVIQWPYHGGTNQQWILVENEDGSISFMSRLAEENGTRYVLDVYGGGMDQGVNVIQWTSTGGNNQKWLLNPVEAHSLTYKTNGGTAVVAGSDFYPGVVLAAPTPPTKDGFVFGGWYKDAGLTQKWYFGKDIMPSRDLTLYAKWEKDFSGIYNIRSKNSDLVMDVFGGGTDQGVNVIQWPHLGQSNQEWKFESLGNGYYKVTSMLSEMSLDVYGGGTALGNKVIQWPYHGGTNQQWRIIENTDGSVSLMSRLAEESGTGYLLDVFGGGMDQGVNVIQWTAHFGDNQKWLLESVTK